MGVTKSVQPYCRFAVITMQMMPNMSWPQRVASDARTVDPGATVIGLLPGVSNFFYCFFYRWSARAGTGIVELQARVPFKPNRYALRKFQRDPSSIDAILELPLQTGRNPHEGRARPAVGVGSDAARGGGRVVTIGGHRSSAGAEIVMGIRSVEVCRHDVVPDQVLRELVLPLRGDHVGLVLVGTKGGTVVGHEGAVVVLTRISGRCECMRPAEMQTVLAAQFLTHDKPGAPPLTLVLECQIRRDRAMQVFDDRADRRLGRELIHDAGRGRILIRNIIEALLLRKRAVDTQARKRRAILRSEGQRNAVCARKVALAVDILVPFTGGGHVERAVRIAEIGAHRIAERAVATR